MRRYAFRVASLCVFVLIVQSVFLYSLHPNILQSVFWINVALALTVISISSVIYFFDKRGQNTKRILTGPSFNALDFQRFFAGWRTPMFFSLVSLFGAVAGILATEMESKPGHYNLLYFSGIPDTILSGVIIGGIAGFGYLLTSAINMFVRVRDNAYELMRFVRFDPEYKQHAQALKALSKKLAEKKNKSQVLYDETVKEVSEATSGANLDDRASVMTMLNFFEMIAISVRAGEVNERIIKEFWLTPLSGYSKSLVGFINYERRGDRKRVFEHLIWLNHRWDRPIEGLCDSG